MAKLKAPLMSLGASGQLGKALVFFPWKGLDVVREYIIPSNPRSTDQMTQRGYLTDAVAAVHLAQGYADLPMDEDDIRAYALWGSTYPTPRTWFNQAVKNYIDQVVAGKKCATYRTGNSAEANEKLTVNIRNTFIQAGHITTGRFYYGKTKTALNNFELATPNLAQHEMVAVLDNLTNGVKYFWQFRPLTLAAYIGCLSGIYHGTPHA